MIIDKFETKENGEVVISYVDNSEDDGVQTVQVKSSRLLHPDLTGLLTALADFARWALGVIVEVSVTDDDVEAPPLVSVTGVQWLEDERVVLTCRVKGPAGAYSVKTPKLHAIATDAARLDAIRGEVEKYIHGKSAELKIFA